ncbi:MAG: hypothetical protein ACJAT8_000521 [Cellvibrionaceae bacterium]|jgi:hypothetical protein
MRYKLMGSKLTRGTLTRDCIIASLIIYQPILGEKNKREALLLPLYQIGTLWKVLYSQLN